MLGQAWPEQFGPMQITKIATQVFNRVLHRFSVQRAVPRDSQPTSEGPWH